MKEQITLMCGGKRCCPSLTINEDKSIDIVDTDDGRNERIHLDPEQAKMLRDQLNKKI